MPTPVSPSMRRVVMGIGALVLGGLAVASLGTGVALAQEAAEDAWSGDYEPSSVDVYGGVGFAYGMTRAEVARRCRAAGHRFLRTRRRGTHRCTGTPAPVARPARTVVRFCRGRLCEVDVLMPLEERNRGVSRWMPWFREIRAAMEDRYGPSERATAARSHCLRNGRTLGRCVLRYGAHVSARWFPENGGVVSLHLVRIRGAGPHLRVIYASGARLAGAGRPERPSRHALALPTGPIPF